MSRTLAIVERELRRFRRSPILIIVSMVFPLVQLLVLGYAFGGTLKHLKIAVVDQDRGMPAVRIRELANAVAAGPQTYDLIDYHDEGEALADLRSGQLNGVLTIPPGFSRRVLTGQDPKIAFVQDNTDSFVTATLVGNMTSLIGEYNAPIVQARISSDTDVEFVELYPFVPYIQYLLPGSITMSVFIMAMLGGGIIFIDDKTRGLHEGYLVTPITKLELVAGFSLSGTIKAAMAGLVVAMIGPLLAGFADPLDLLRMARVFLAVAITAFALISMMFLLMVRASNPSLPRAIFSILNSLLYFPSGAVYPVQGFPAWMQWIAMVNPFTYSVRALKSLLLKGSPLMPVAGDLIYLFVFGAVAMGAATVLFRRTL